jgi:hypothetical protein
LSDRGSVATEARQPRIVCEHGGRIGGDVPSRRDELAGMRSHAGSTIEQA